MVLGKGAIMRRMILARSVMGFYLSTPLAIKWIDGKLKVFSSLRDRGNLR